MAEKKKSFKKYLYGIIVPILIMVVTLSVIGVSYAWFSNSVETEISTIRLTTAEIFTLEFTVGEDSKTYQGQKAVLGSSYDANYLFPIGEDGGHLVTEQWATQMGLSSSSSNSIVRAAYNRYMEDTAFGPYVSATDTGARFPLRLDTDGKSVDLKITISSVLVSKEGAESLTINIPSSAKEYTTSDIAYGFTWFLETGGNKYTPYGNYSTLSSKSDFSTTSNITLSATTESIGENETNAYFTIVFAPEQLYWMQYSNYQYSTNKYMWMKTVSEVYTDYSNTNGVFKAKWNDINKYSAIAYAGSTFKFDIEIEVVAIH